MSIEKMHVWVKTRNLWIYRVEANGLLDAKSYQHTIFHLTLKKDDKYAVNLIHAQSGHDSDAIIPWLVYVNARVCSIDRIQE